MSADEIEMEYENGKQMEAANKLKTNWENITGNYIIFDNFYDMIGNVALARCVDLTDAKVNECMNKYLFSTYIIHVHQTYI